MPRPTFQIVTEPDEYDDVCNEAAILAATIDTPKQYDSVRRSILSDHDASIWLRVAIQNLERRPPLEALDDCYTLYQLARARCRILEP